MFRYPAPSACQIDAALRSGRADYDGRTGELRIDIDGRGGPEAPGLVAVIEGGGRIGVEDVILF
ncbi:hypothetical protein [Jannaschia formosa]|uniref:hypothetical protein n=1 Tax=Jannaschia formosa TaxID=2259592 RepID=UPI000E1BAAAA|nr:hypothetical protein [Jannaschia formosa]TFL18710.1 hypothetical protein DR046_07215 [Jannaschia formosa]